MSKTIYCITGVAGFIGFHLACTLLERESESIVVGIDNFFSGSRTKVNMLKEKYSSHERFIFFEADLTDTQSIEKIFIAHKINKVFHLAAIVSVAKSIEEPLFTHSVNVNATLNILELSRKFDIKRFVFASSAAVYGDEPSLPKNEESPVRPISPYGAQKLICEEYLKLYSIVYGLSSVSLRFFNVYGHGQNPKSDYAGVISIFCDKLKDDTPVTIYGDGEQCRDFIHVSDVIKALLAAAFIENPKPIYCVGSGIKTTINDLYRIVAKAKDCSLSPIYAPIKKGDILESVCDNRLMCTDFGLTEIKMLEDGIGTL